MSRWYEPGKDPASRFAALEKRVADLEALVKAYHNPVVLPGSKQVP